MGVRAECEAHLRSTGFPATILRPWYVLGPGHLWPLLLLPLYWLAERVPTLAPRARSSGLVRLEQMVAALVWAVEHPCQGQRAEHGVRSPLHVRASRALARLRGT